jgi:TolA-binding protein
VTDHSKDELAAKRLLDDGIALFRGNKLREAIAKLMEIVARFPRSSVADNAHYNLGMIYERLGLKEKAHNEYEATVLFYPGSDAAAFAKDRLEELEQAADPAASLFRSAQELYRTGHAKEAMHRYEELIEQFPSSALVDNALLGLGMLHRAQGDEKRAQELFEELRTKYPDSDAARLLKDS